MLDRLFLLLNVDTHGNYEIGESRLEDNMNIEEITEDDVKRAVDTSRNGKAPGCTFLDLENAFDRIPRGNLWQALNTYEIPMDL